jgi:hypothetical protein
MTTKSCYDDTWMYDAASDTWTELTPSTRPPARQNACLLDYPYGGGLLMAFGGADRSSHTQMNDTWLLNTTKKSWTQLDTLGGPSRRDCSAGFYSPVDRTMYIFGGWDRTYVPSVPAYALWRLDDLWCIGPRGFPNVGTYTSAPMDAGGRAYFGTISAETTTSVNTIVRLQLRAAITLAGLLAAPFVGPDGTAGTYYDGTEERVHGSLNGSRWMQYRATLSTSDPAETPHLRGVTVRYNLLQEVAVTSPRAGDTVSTAWNIPRERDRQPAPRLGPAQWHR